MRGVSTVVLAVLLMNILATPPFVWSLQQLSNVVEKPEISTEKRQKVTKESLTLVWLGSASTHNLTEDEQKHMLDVHQVFRLLWIEAGGAFIVIFGLREFIEMRQVWTVRLANILSGVLIGCALVGVAGFSMFFEFFHKVFFPQGNYSFPIDSALIQTFPLSFWITAFTGLILGFILSIQVLARVFNRRIPPAV